MNTVQRIQVPQKKEPERKRVAAYARVSTNHERQENSLTTQIDYYTKLIKSNSSWDFVKVYIDDGISGTQIKKRTQFQELIKACETGSVDIILTKSISRFARNTLDLLSTVRQLKKLRIEVRFEKEKINTLSETGELMLTLLGSIAQEESRSTSENLKWAVKKRYEKGISLHHRVFGYQWTGKKMVPEPNQAKVIRKIFRDYLNGKTMQQIADNLNSRQIKHFGKPFNKMAIHTFLHNERYIGDTLLQKTYCKDFMSHSRKKNRGDHPMYYVEDTHEAIISREIFIAVTGEIRKRKELGVFIMPKANRRCFTQKIKCEKCGNNYIRTYKTPTNANWRCSSNRKYGAKGCRSIGINEEQLKILSAFVMSDKEFDEGSFNKEVDHITGYGDGKFTFHFVDGRSLTQFWDSMKRARNTAIDKKKQQEKQHANNKSNTSN